MLEQLHAQVLPLLAEHAPHGEQRKTWTVDLDGTRHTVVLEWTYYSGRREVAVDGRVVDRSRIPMRWRSTQSFEIDGHPAAVRTQPSRRMSPWFVITLEVDGVAVSTEPGMSRWEARGTTSQPTALNSQ